MGESHEVSIAGWLGDVGIAAEQLAAKSGQKKLVAVGLRLGGTLAALASSRQGLRLRHLVLWDPVVDGGAYLRELAGQHRSYMQHEMGAEAWRDRLRVSADGVPAESLGTPIGPALASELAAIDLTAEALRTDHVTVVATRENAAAARLRARLAGAASARWLELPASESWNSDAALNAAIVPMDAVQAIVTRIEELSP
jgi:pimeloyl-ACP methyl ester carboxylesterase